MGRPGWGSAIVEAQLDWYGLPFAFEPVEDLLKTAGAKAKLEKVNPLAQVPTLVLPDGTVKSESAAITLLLADLTGQDSLVPAAGAPERASFLRWLVFLVANIYTHLHLCRRSVALRLGQQRARSVPRRHRRLCPAAVAPGRERGRHALVFGRAVLRLDLYIDVMTRWRPAPWLVRDRDAQAVRHRAQGDQRPELKKPGGGTSVETLHRSPHEPPP